MCEQKELCVKCGGGMVFGVESGVALKCRAYVRSGSGEGPGHYIEAPGLVPRATEEPLGLKKRKCWHSCRGRGHISIEHQLRSGSQVRLPAGGGTALGSHCSGPGPGQGRDGEGWRLCCHLDVRTLSHWERSGALLVGMDFAQRPIPCVGRCFQCSKGWRRIY